MRIPFLALIVVPLAELYLLFAVADLIGGLATLALVILTAAVGLSVLRYQGFSTLNRANQRMAAGQLPGQEIVEGMMLAVAGALLLTPGLITDTIGFLLLTPVVRKRLAKRAISKGSGFFVGGFASGTRWQSGPSNSRGRGDI
ncbi:MAG TPA: hypothetical protein DEG76_16110, partial [Pseudohongiella sp.]|nr:hypothetical protein [Pseudohongiella sp.]